ncbi:uncharacterized protein TRAVEDRAFT_60635 [Trametes versicolor FP-101664 SS1]|uniref:uncharacterized protein n=1 Tax=Trametes versicolor (strain FP-101664) TaxID=717944 RepID=UPI0004622EEC|nr:uncharacterized protein TRAVEDRAFT_60635 [Trametes versicolor FP-101664 SS1]EIW54334.1 hypothetical protein TRAVEDRAFT_60635 [Trametes versicolor FP-101664 SS1]
MSFAAPVPRIPLVSVLRHLDASWAPISPAASASAPTYAHDATQGPEGGAELPQLGLGLVLGMGGVPIYIPRGQLDLGSPSQSQSRYSQRLRSIAPAPLQLASPTPRAPLRTLRQPAAQTPPALTSAHRVVTPASAVFADVPLATADLFATAFSISPPSDRKGSTSSAMASPSTAPTSLVFPGDSENRHPGWSTNPPTYVDTLNWQRSPSRSLGSPYSPFTPRSAHAGPSNLRRTVYSPKTPTRKSTREPQVLFTPAGQTVAAPPPLLRTGIVSLPDVTDEGLPSPESQLLSPLHANLRLDMNTEDLMLRTEKCSETIARASLSLCSCSLLREPEAIIALCDALRETFLSVQRALDGTPSDFSVDGVDAKRLWYVKHWQVIASLDRNLNLFYLLAHQIEKRPPRIHTLASLIDKLSTYQAKFADLARRITLSHEKFRFLGLRAQLSSRTPVADHEDHVLLHDARATRQEGRARRREIREEITRVRGRMRSICERDLENTGMPNTTFHDEDEDMDRPGWVRKDGTRR